jgi:phosphonate transport system permease protein
MFEYNVRSSTIIGVVGAGGIGMQLGQYLKLLQYDRVMALLALMFVTVVILDAISYRLRRAFLETEGPRARWRDLLVWRMGG